MIEIVNRQRKQKLDRDRLRNLLERLVAHYGLDAPEVTLAFVNNATIQDLNRNFLGKNAPTDVLAFPFRETGADGKFYLGDIIISVEKALEQARKRHHPLERELEILAIHGFLHLLGFEHFKGLEEEEEKIQNLYTEGHHGR
ncbi:MAG: rRNA maturation RNase YbeY [Candidatus Aminicenantales bacterium]